MTAWIGRMAGGIGAVTSKELRGRMRGWRAFVALTIYVALLAAFTVLVYFAARRGGLGGTPGTPFIAAGVGQTIFEVLMVVQTILVVFLAPAFTSGAISLEREKQTLDLLAATPVPTLAIVLGKLAAALAFVLILILASIPLVAVVFVFGGVAPDDIVRGYAVLLAAGFGFGCVGLALSSITRRTQAATVLTWLMVLALTLGSVTVFYLWHMIATPGASQGPNMAFPVPAPAVGPAVDMPGGATDSTGFATATPAPSTEAKVPGPPEWLLWLNPGVAMGDVICGVTQNAYGYECRGVDLVLGEDSTVLGAGGGAMPGGFMVQPGMKGGVFINGGTGGGSSTGVLVTGRIGGDLLSTAPGVPAFSGVRDRFWPTMVLAWVVMGIVLVAFSVLMVRPRRGLRPRLRGAPKAAKAAP
jgi:ABC-type transport system involved in multi-copper enzyme maturation permease subunit